jgi:hypothetical protein
MWEEFSKHAIKKNATYTSLEQEKVLKAFKSTFYTAVLLTIDKMQEAETTEMDMDRIIKDMVNEIAEFFGQEKIHQNV